jgi:CrcB protein
MTAVLVFLGAAVGAPARYLTDRAVQIRHDTLFPWGTLAVNVLGCFVLGALAGAGTAESGPVFAVLGTGFCGALTTYSTFSYETLRLVEGRSFCYAVANCSISVVAGVGAAYLGYALLVALV